MARDYDHHIDVVATRWMANDSDPRYRRILWLNDQIDWRTLTVEQIMVRGGSIIESEGTETLVIFVDNTVICWS